MATLRRPMFFIAVALIAIVVLAELGATGVVRGAVVSASALRSTVPSDVRDEYDDLDDGRRQELTQLRTQEKPPGLAIPYLALLDGLVLFAVVLIGVSLLIPEGVHGRIQGIATLIVSILAILGGLALLFVAIGATLLMIALLLAVPFGTIAYFARFAFFDHSGARIILSLLMLLKLGFAGCLVFAHQRFLQNAGLVLLVLTSLLANVLISFLHGFPPGFLVSIADAIGAIVVAILALIWSIFLLIGAVISIIKVLRIDRALKDA